MMRFNEISKENIDSSLAIPNVSHLKLKDKSTQNHKGNY